MDFKRYFDTYSSNSLAGSSNQYFFENIGGEEQLSRSFYRIERGGRRRYSLLFSDMISSPFRSLIAPGTVIDGWEVLEARVGRCAALGADAEMENAVMDEDIRVEWLSELRFDGMTGYRPFGGEVFYSDGVELEFQRGEFLCLEIKVRGERVPCHPESQLPIFVSRGGKWEYSTLAPIAEMIGADGEARRGRIGFLGDSITQGCGAGHNTYAHWNARLASFIGEDYSYHNLGIGYGRAEGAATDGIWLKKAKENDTVFLCFGVNDINADRTADEVIGDLNTVIDKLTEAGCRIILQTVPPFNYPPSREAVWGEVNRRIMTELSGKVAFTFDCVPLLSESAEKPHVARYGGHPNGEGCLVWAKALYEAVRNLF